MLRALVGVTAVVAASAATAAEPRTVVGPPVTAAAAPGPQGYIGARYGGLWGVGSRIIDEKTAAAEIPFRNGFMELEGRGAGFFLAGSPAAAAMAAGHFYRRGADRAFGAFGGYEVYPGAGVLFFGFEAQATYGGVVPYAQLAIARAADNGANGWWLRTGVRLFPSPNVMVQGDVRYSIRGGSSWLFSGTAEVRRDGRPWSGYATLNYQTGIGSGGGAATSFLAGIHIQLGNSTLYQAYTTGAVWNLLPTAY